MKKGELLNYELCFDEVTPLTEQLAYEGLGELYLKWLRENHPEVFDKKKEDSPVAKQVTISQRKTKKFKRTAVR